MTTSRSDFHTTTTATTEPTLAQIEALAAEARATGDTEMVEICEQALYGCATSREACADAIRAVRATDDEVAP